MRYIVAKVINVDLASSLAFKRVSGVPDTSSYLHLVSLEIAEFVRIEGIQIYYNYHSARVVDVCIISLQQSDRGIDIVVFC